MSKYDGQRPNSPLRQRTIDYMNLRGLSARTLKSSLRELDQLIEYHGCAPQLTEASLPGEPVGARLTEIGPVSLRLVSDDREKDEWNEPVEYCHYLGYRQPVSAHLRYFIVDGSGQWLGCLMFQRAAVRLRSRLKKRRRRGGGGHQDPHGPVVETPMKRGLAVYSINRCYFFLKINTAQVSSL